MQCSLRIAPVLLLVACSSSPTPQPTTAASATQKDPTHSCFSYVVVSTNETQHMCARTESCPQLHMMVQQSADAETSIRDQTACAPVPSVWCYRRYDEVDAKDIHLCVRTADDCKAKRQRSVDAGDEVTSECAEE